MAGSVTKRKDGRWQGSYQYTIDGKNYRKYFYSDTKLDCEKKLYEIISKIQNKEA